MSGRIQVAGSNVVSLPSRTEVGAYAVTGKFAERNPDAVKRSRAAVGDTARYLMAHQSGLRTFLAERGSARPGWFSASGSSRARSRSRT